MPRFALRMRARALRLSLRLLALPLAPQPMQRSWEEITEDESGGLRSTQLAQERARKARLDAATSVGSGVVIERCVLRYVFVLLDCSWAMDGVDLKPSRRAVA